MSDFETVIGVEVHVELSTATKMFCSCPNEFGGEPNTRTCPVCLGLPGSLPVVNEKAVEYAIKIGLALDCEIAESSLFHRKNYFYPDMPKNFQISQYDEPICVDGHLEVEVGGRRRRVGIIRAHLEEDTGKSVHLGASGRIHEASHSLEDYNRAGVPLVEIVSAPDITSPAEARQYVSELRQVLLSLGVSDVKMEEGSLRCDANISTRRRGSDQFGAKVEIKNMNSLRSLQRALEFEESRQRELLTSGGRVLQETRHWNEDEGVTHSMRSKEEAFDYRYFPEPDLLPIRPDPEWVSRIRDSLPELPAARRSRLATEYGLSVEQIATLTGTDGLLAIFTGAVDAGADPTEALNWTIGDVLAQVRAEGLSDASHSGIDGPKLAELCALVSDGTLSTKLAKQILAKVCATGDSPRELVEREGLSQLSDMDELERIVTEIIDANPDEAERFKNGERKLMGFFIGEAMKATRGKANPKALDELFSRKLAV